MRVIFDQLRISRDGKTMYIDAHVNTHSDFRNVTIQSVTIASSDQVSELNPSALPTEYLNKTEFDSGQTSISLSFTKDDFIKINPETHSASHLTQYEMDHTLFFIYVETQGEVPGTSSCGADIPIEIGVTFNDGVLHRMVMDYVRSIGDDCNVPNDFVNFILLWNAFKSAIITGNYRAAIDFYHMLFATGSNSSVTTSRCGCHG